MREKIKLSPLSVYDLERILKDPQLLGFLVMDGKDKIAQTVTVHDNGSITLGQTRSGWYNRLFGLQEVIPFGELKDHLLRILMRDKSDDQKKSAYLDTVNSCFIKRNYDEAVKTLMIIYYLGFANPELVKNNKQNTKQNQQRKEVVVKCGSSVTKIAAIINGGEVAFFDVNES